MEQAGEQRHTHVGGTSDGELVAWSGVGLVLFVPERIEYTGGTAHHQTDMQDLALSKRAPSYI